MESDNLTSAAPLLCAGVTAYSALKKVSKNQPGGSWLNIIGIGGVGPQIVDLQARFHKLMRCRSSRSSICSSHGLPCDSLYVVHCNYNRVDPLKPATDDITQEKLNLAKEYGAEKAFNSLELGDTEVSKTYSTIVISGAAQAYDLAFRATIPHGTVFAVGVPPHPIPLNSEIPF